MSQRRHSEPVFGPAEQHNIHSVAARRFALLRTPLPFSFEASEKNQLARRREEYRRSPWRQNSNRWGFATGRASGIFSSSVFRGSDARTTNSSPCCISHSASSAIARSSTHCWATLSSSFLLLADLFSCFTWNSCRRALDRSKRYAMGGSKGLFSFTRPPWFAETAHCCQMS